MLKEILVKILGLVKRHVFSTLALIAYCGLWGYFIHWFTSGKASYPHSCGAANAGMLVITLFISLLTIVVFGVLSMIHKGQNRKDYVTFLLVFMSPIVLLFLFQLF
ncbi:hypothetical protein [Carboxylicivirga sp. N1Y90]|uniref:hypothetical protein n=1 Tax=Carboxylicivirga fragile TaxID=3417571 RepID=UPI003D3262AA|nr:hypothetical protein [Marinilabiliaceae bacterium N1Y90]